MINGMQWSGYEISNEVAMQWSGCEISNEVAMHKLGLGEFPGFTDKANKMISLQAFSTVLR